MQKYYKIEEVLDDKAVLLNLIAEDPTNTMLKYELHLLDEKIGLYAKYNQIFNF